MNDRLVNILTGLIGIVFVLAVSLLGIKVAGGALRPVYHVDALFSAAGQGLIKDSDVKVHGFNIGRVAGVRLSGGRALVRMAIDDGQRIPVDARATVRPKTLFGEKFVDIDPGRHERGGPFLKDGGRIQHAVGGFELEKVLTQAYPILKAVDPAELATLVGTLADAGRGMGPTINRQIVNWQKVAAVSAAHDADTRQFLSDLADLTGTLADHSGDVVGAARDLNVVLPDVNRRGDELTTFLEQTSRLSGDVADVLEANRPFLNKSVAQGGKSLQILYDEQHWIPPFLVGLQHLFQTLAEATSHPDLVLPDGSRMVAIRFVYGGGKMCGRAPLACPFPDTPPVPVPGGPSLPAAGLLPLPLPTNGAQAITQLIGSVLR